MTATANTIVEIAHTVKPTRKPAVKRVRKPKPAAVKVGLPGIGAVVGGGHLSATDVLTADRYPVKDTAGVVDVDVIQVQTRYFSAEDMKGARVGARILNGAHKGRRLTSGYDYAAKDAHASAVKSLMAKLDIVGTVEPVRDVRSGMVFTITA